MTYLSPGIPRAFFEAVAGCVGRELRIRISLLEETRVSGPARGGDDPFSSGEADAGFLCAPPYFWLRGKENPPVELAGAAPVFRDDRAPGEPVYFSEVVVRRESPVRSFHELRGRSWAYNDPCSLSGYYCLLEKLAGMGEDEGFVRRVYRSGSHLNSMGMVSSGEVDAAAVDSNVMRIALRSDPELRERLRVIESWGPFPIQPVVLRSALDAKLKDGVRAALLALDPRVSPALTAFGLERFAPVTYEHYAAEERVLRERESVLGTMARHRCVRGSLDHAGRQPPSS